MKYLVLIIFILIASITVGIFISNDAGYLLIRYADTSIETNLAITFLSLLLSFTALYYGFRFLGLVLRTPAGWNKLILKHRKKRIHVRLMEGFLAIQEARWEKAERLLTRGIETSDLPSLHYLLAAQAAQSQQQIIRRDEYLKKLATLYPDGEIGIDLARLKLLLNDRPQEAVLASLQQLLETHPKHEQLLVLASKAYFSNKEWQRLVDLLPELRRRKLIDPEQLTLYESTAWKGLLSSAKKDNVTSTWENLPKLARENDHCLAEYLEALLQLRLYRIAEPLLRQRLNRKWNSTLVKYYGLLGADDSVKQLEHAELWLKQHGRDPALLLCLGRICSRRKLWGKARIYFESSLAIEVSAETYQALGRLLEQLGETELALQNYRAGLDVGLPQFGEQIKPRLVHKTTSLTPPPSVAPQPSQGRHNKA